MRLENSGGLLVGGEGKRLSLVPFQCKMFIKYSNVNLEEIYVEVILTVVRGQMVFVMVDFTCQCDWVKVAIKHYFFFFFFR